MKEVGRITIAGAHLDVWMGLLWQHLDMTTTEDDCRGALGSVQRKAVRRLARDRLLGPLQQRVLDAVDAVQEAQRRRNEVVHQEWLLRSVDVMRPVSELSAIPPAERRARREEWQRETIDSPDWQRAPRDTVQVVPAQRLGELKAVERELFRVGELVQTLTFRVAGARVDGASAGNVGPPDQPSVES
ncbi:MAG: hypothetical protein ACXV5Q_01210 [Frankiaceae bacterium]